MSQHKITITAGPGFGQEHIELDGHDITEALQGLDIRMRVGSYPQIKLALNVHEIQTFDMAEAELLIPTDVRDALVALGWTPPPNRTGAGSAGFTMERAMVHLGEIAHLGEEAGDSQWDHDRRHPVRAEADIKEGE
jgi:hypothetical protein